MLLDYVRLLFLSLWVLHKLISITCITLRINWWYLVTARYWLCWTQLRLKSLWWSHRSARYCRSASFGAPAAALSTSTSQVQPILAVLLILIDIYWYLLNFINNHKLTINWTEWICILVCSTHFGTVTNYQTVRTCPICCPASAFFPAFFKSAINLPQSVDCSAWTVSFVNLWFAEIFKCPGDQCCKELQR